MTRRGDRTKYDAEDSRRGVCFRRGSPRCPTSHAARYLVSVSLLALAGCRSESDPTTPEKETVGPQQQAVAAPQLAASAPSHAVAGPPGKPHPAPAGCLSAGCHADLTQVTHRHDPVHTGACDACHQSEQPDHKFPLRRSGLEACTFCHPVAGHKKYLHQVINKEGCLSCHDPHGSNTKFLLTGPSTELICQACHKLERKAHLHGPFAGGECTVCHQPHESDNPFLLIGGEGKDHCLVCHRGKHRQLAAARTVHKPIEEGCTGCHQPHSSDFDQLLIAPLETLCFKCHPHVEGNVAEAKSPHGAVFTGHRCANCHDPHAEGRPALLRDELQTLCLRCHDRPQQAYDGRTIPDMRPALLNRKHLHGPVRSGQCNACHQVHGSRYAKLLRRYFPPQFYQAYDLANYALCFECHSEGLVLQERTTIVTNFRHGQRNLHYLHVNRPEKGRTCRVCHEIHGSNLPRHMAGKVPFEGSSWSMPVKFEQTETGGRCSPGCHEPMAYERQATTPVPLSASKPTGEGVKP